MLAVAAASWRGRDIAVPLFLTTVASDRYTVTAAVPPAFQTIPLYTLEGELLGIISGDGPERHAFPAGQAIQSLLARASKGERSASLGVFFQELTPALQQAFGEGGVLMSDVVEGGPADQAGLQAGDVLVRIGDAEVTTVEATKQAVSALHVATEMTLELRRAGRIRSVQVAPALTYQVSWLARRERSTASAVEAGAVFSTEVLEGAGIAPDARVLSVNGRVVSSRAQVDRELRRARSPLRVLLHDGDTQFFAAIAPRR
jgi:membrane-associated protease RseP (regulator of RpoE activity)